MRKKALSLSSLLLLAATGVYAQPRITGVSPAFANTGRPYSIRILGANFTSNSVARLNGTAQTTRFVSASELVASGTMTVAAGGSAVFTVTRSWAPTSNPWGILVAPPVSVTIWTPWTSLRLGDTAQFIVQVQNHTDLRAEWRVNGVVGGSAATGTIDATGLYTAPLVMPAGPVQVTAVSTADATAVSAPIALTLTNPVPTLESLSPASAEPGTTATLTLRGSKFVNGAQVWVGTQAVTPTFVNDQELRVMVQLTPVQGRRLPIWVRNPAGGGDSLPRALVVEPANPLVPYADAVRFLEQATWGATPAEIDRLQRIGYTNWINEQLTRPVTPVPDALPPTTVPGFSFQFNEGVERLRQNLLWNALSGQDQLRQRVAWALHRFVVVSSNELMEYRMIVPYWRILTEGALGNYRTLLGRLSRDPSMTTYLDMVNSGRSATGSPMIANQNYARELMQLFTIGQVGLNPDGTPTGQPAYTEEHVAAFARAFTGWSYAPLSGSPQWMAPLNFSAPLVAVSGWHDTQSKTLLNGVTLAGGATAEQDMTAALDNVMAHANVAPFVSYRLIQGLVKSDPTPAYVARVAAVFNNNGAGVKGDLAAVVRAILLDAEARSAGPQSFREPLVYALNLIRAGGGVSDATMDGVIAAMGQTILGPPSVFGYGSPSYRPPGMTTPAPEMASLTGPAAMERINFAYRLYNGDMGYRAYVPSELFQLLADTPDALLDAVSVLLHKGAMRPELRSIILTAVQAQPDRRQKALAALYLASASSEYQVRQ